MRGGNLENVQHYIQIAVFATCLILVLLQNRRYYKTRNIVGFILFYIILIFVSFNNPILKCNSDIDDLNLGMLSVENDSSQLKLLAEVINQSKEENKLNFNNGNYLLINTKNIISYKLDKITNTTKFILDKILFNNASIYSPHQPSSGVNLMKSILGYIYVLLIISIIPLCRYLSRKKMKLFSFLLLISCLLLAFIGTMIKYELINFKNDHQIFGIWNLPDSSNHFSSFAYKNHWASFSLLSIFHGVALLISEYKRKSRFTPKMFLLMVFCVFISFTLFIIDSRSAIFFLFLYIILILYYIFKNKAYWILSIILLTSMSFIFMKHFRNTHVFERSVLQVENLQRGNLPFRALLWNDAISQIENKTFYGYGFGSYQQINPLFQSDETVHERFKVTSNAHREFIPIIQNSHSDFLQGLTEYGFVSYSLFIFPVCFLILRQFLLVKSHYIKALCIGCFIYLLYCFVDLPNKSNASFTLVVLTISFVINHSRSQHTH